METRTTKKIEIKDLKLNDIKIGIELECVYNKDILKLDYDDIGGYHSPKSISNFWRAECDGSLNTYGETFNGIAKNAELTTPTIKINKYKDAIADLKILCNNEDLDNVLCFNKSCGCHFHFSIPDKFYKNIPNEIFLSSRKFFFKQLRNSEIIPTEIKEGIRKHYFRHYAQRFKPSHKNCRTRYTEFNFVSENNNMGMEWRSFNILGVETWEQMEEMFKIATNTIKYLSNALFNYEIIETTKIKNTFEIKEQKEEVTISKSNYSNEFIQLEKFEPLKNEVIKCVI